MWTQENTEGFTAAELVMLNNILDRIAADAEEIDPGNINDAINNEWRDGIAEADLEAAARRALRIA
jgi:hypothetical protein